MLASILLAALVANPLMSLRLRGPHTSTDAQWRETFKVLSANPGCCDEVWFSTGVSVPSLDWHREHAARLVRAAADLRRIGVVPSLQVQATIGHSDDLTVNEDYAAMSWTGWTGSTGVEDKRCSCPRQPGFLAYFRELARIYAAFRPGSVWIDDDLRIDGHRPATDKSRHGCWCATCIAAFNAETGGNWTRETLDKACKDPALLKKWRAFSIRSLADVARVIAEEMHRHSPETTMALQFCHHEGAVDKVLAVARALHEATGLKVGLRPGGGAYYEIDPKSFVIKSMTSCWFRRRIGDPDVVGTWCPEVESWPRAYGSRSAQAAIVESFAAFMYGMNATSLLLLDTRYEKDDLYSRFILKPLAGAAPVLKGYAKANEGTVPVGFAADGLKPDRLYRWGLCGVPVLPGVGRKLGDLTKDDLAMDIYTTGSADVQAKRNELDARACGMPAVVESPFVGLVLPRVAADGSLRTVALMNTRIEAQGPVTLRLRGVPASVSQLTWSELRKSPVTLPVTREGDVVRVTVPEIAAWNAGYIH